MPLPVFLPMPMPRADGASPSPGVSAALRHWHPVLPAARLRRRPVEVRLCDTEIVLWRDAAGRPAALDGRCPHRGMRLALGAVEGDGLVCAYHGWRFDAAGCGRSPGTPDLRIRTGRWDIRESDGTLWLRRAVDGESPPPLPDLRFKGYRPLARLHHRVAAPFQLLVDNMSELEHTGSVHSAFGFEQARLHEVATRVEARPDQVDIHYEGPQRRLAWHLALPTGISRGDRFVQTASLRFDPVHATYDLRWEHPATGASRPLDLRFVIFFNPVDEHRCEQFTHVFVRPATRTLDLVLRSFGFLLVRQIDAELRADIRLVESLQLGPDAARRYRHDRFDQPLREAASRIRSLYFQADA